MPSAAAPGQMREAWKKNTEAGFSCVRIKTLRLLRKPPCACYATNRTSFSRFRQASPVSEKELGRLLKIPAFAQSPAIKSGVQRGDNLAEINSHPFLDLINCPSPLVSTMQLFESTSIGLDVLGESFWWHPLGADGLPFSIVPLPASRVCPKFSDGGEVERFEFLNWSGKLIQIPPEEISWFRVANPFHPFKSKSWVAGVCGRD